MKYIQTSWELPFYNFALEEYLLNHAQEEDCFFFYIHRPSIIIGKHQNAIEELNKDYVDENGIVVARRLSGGGAVYHDHGNLNFSFIQKASADEVGNFGRFTEPVIKALKALGIDAELSGRNDILIDGKKISGNAQCYKNNRILSHGTLLYHADLSKLSAALKVKDIKVQSKGIKSVRSRVTNIRDHLSNELSIHTFSRFMFQYLIQEYNAKERKLSNEEKQEICKIAEEKFASWDYVWGNSPKYEIQRVKKFPFGIVDARLNIRKGQIEECRIFGDFFSAHEIEELEHFLVGKKYEKEALAATMEDSFIGRYFKDLNACEFAAFLSV